MIKILILFIALWACMTGSVGVYRQMKGLQTWSNLQMGAVGLLIAVVLFAIFIGIAVLI